MKSENKYCQKCGAALGGAILTIALMAGEMIPTFCHECGHIDQPHDHREGFSHEFIGTPTVSGISSTISASFSDYLS